MVLYKLSVKIFEQENESSSYIKLKIYGSINQILNYISETKDNSYHHILFFIEKKDTINEIQIPENLGKFEIKDTQLFDFNDDFWQLKIYLYDDIDKNSRHSRDKKIYGFQKNLFNYVSENIDNLAYLNEFKWITLKKVKCEVLI